MLGTNLMDRRSRTERITDDAWDHLRTFVDSARSRTTGLAGLASDAGSAVSGAVGAVGGAASVVGGATDEGRRRAALAYDALAGRRMPMPWTLVIAAAALGAAIGWAAGSASRAAIARMSDRADSGRVDEIEFIEADRAKSTLDS
jgi:divalent metal cation (Fe/Co/Zn/Cd) transporter